MHFSQTVLLVTFIILVNFLEKVVTKSGVLCMQCGGDKYEGNVSLTRNQCCESKPVWCTEGEICLRAWVFSPYGKFFLSGCHPDENGLSGCQFHHLPHNSTVNRCICRDSECQNSFPGDCLPRELAKLTTTQKTLTTKKPSLNRGRHHHSHHNHVNLSKSSSSFIASLLVFVWFL